MGKGFRRVLSALFLALITSAHGAAGAAAANAGEESAPASYRSGVSEVRLVFFATDEHNQNVEELQKDDFAVVDNERVIRDFRGFTRAGLTNLDVVVLIDMSESVAPHVLNEATDTLQMISQWSWRPADKISVLSFSGMKAHVICLEDCRGMSGSDLLANVPRGGVTPLFDTLETATDLLVQRGQPDVWPVIILFSDGEDTISKTSFDHVRRKILAAGVQVYAVDVSTADGPSNGSAILGKIADGSGGRYVRIGESPVKILNQVIGDLHSSRVVSYLLPPSDSGFHSVRLYPTRNLKLQFHSRTGYYRNSDGSSSEGRP